MKAGERVRAVLRNEERGIQHDFAVPAVNAAIDRSLLRRTIATADGKQRDIRSLCATIADRDDFITRFLSYDLDRRWTQRLIQLSRLQPSDRVLDLARGTGDLTFGAAPHVRRSS